MGLIKGQLEYRKWKKNQRLTRKEAMLAQCYDCNGQEQVDCKAEKSCPMYQYSPYNSSTATEKPAT
jgi:hypothetical protein